MRNEAGLQALPRAELAAGVAGLRCVKTRHPGGADQDGGPGPRITPGLLRRQATREAAKTPENDALALAGVGLSVPDGPASLALMFF